MNKTNKTKAAGSWIAAAVILVVVIVAGVFLVRRALHPGSAPGQVATSAETANPASPSSSPHPAALAQAGIAAASTAMLPALNDSDDEVAAALTALAGGELRSLLVPRQIIARIVATIDALPRHAGLGPTVLPAQPPKGAFLTSDTDGGKIMAAENPARYAPYMTLVENTDAQALVDWYVRDYALFQEAYRQLGYPKASFNDRLLVVLDDLLAAPELAQPAVLQPSKAYYVYADPALESLSTGQKLLLRLGPANEAKVKAKLRLIRAALVARNK
ncbi:MAG: DUF3014 domain-containing protein [Xanthomonadales bacterium]|nr:DUF3014 domain-containing protein [Xanthomonadales bacterium]